jgi:hypothetical protein
LGLVEITARDFATISAAMISVAMAAQHAMT